MTTAHGFDETQRRAALPGPPYRPGMQVRTDGQAVAVLVLALMSFVFLPVIPAIIALCLAPGARRNIATSGGWLTGGRMTTAGVVLARVNIALAVLLAAAIYLYPWAVSYGF